MEKTSRAIVDRFGEQLYFFILKKVKNKDIANDIFQNTILKIHAHIDQVKEPVKIKSWIFQIARNGTMDHFRERTFLSEEYMMNLSIPQSPSNKFCCFDRFIEELPENYRVCIEKVYLDGMKQQEAAVRLGISLANLKARVRRAKGIIKQRFRECCKYSLDERGMLVGEPDCSYCAD
ncbi:sigma-70 family RNA polymerase sigma factor [Echinicola shivajiensis]|uniref:sigma-70 family RNA polymerase sigma factor n=1 Tax=Echinicola shivajiensis TaxID=1035916 RepID=UPI001BFC43E3|nr:sigma-70 family RNA polymerase sigma factor [Echinicola shivajiensis]